MARQFHLASRSPFHDNIIASLRLHAWIVAINSSITLLGEAILDVLHSEPEAESQRIEHIPSLLGRRQWLPLAAIQAVATKAAIKDAGVAWLMEVTVSSVTKVHPLDEQA